MNVIPRVAPRMPRNSESCSENGRLTPRALYFFFKIGVVPRFLIYLVFRSFLSDRSAFSILWQNVLKILRLLRKETKTQKSSLIFNEEKVNKVSGQDQFPDLSCFRGPKSCFLAGRLDRNQAFWCQNILNCPGDSRQTL